MAAFRTFPIRRSSYGWEDGGSEIAPVTPSFALVPNVVEAWAAPPADASTTPPFDALTRAQYAAGMPLAALTAFDPYAGITPQFLYGAEGGDRYINPATTPANYAALLNRETLNALGAPASFVTINNGGAGDTSQLENVINPAFTKWAADRQYSLSGDWQGDSNTATLKNSQGQVVASGALSGDSTFFAFALAVVAVFTGGTLLLAETAPAALTAPAAAGLEVVSPWLASVPTEVAASVAETVAAWSPDLVALLPTFDVAAAAAVAAPVAVAAAAAPVTAPAAAGLEVVSPWLASVPTEVAASVAEAVAAWSPDLVALLPSFEIAAPLVAAAVEVAAPASFNSAVDSQLASNAAGITGADAAAAAVAPASVDLGTLGGSMSTGGGALSPWVDAAVKKATDTLTNAAIKAGLGALVGGGASAGSAAAAHPARPDLAPSSPAAARPAAAAAVPLAGSTPPVLLILAALAFLVH